MTIKNHKKLGQWEHFKNLIKDLELEDVFESVWGEPVAEAPRDVSENVLIEDTLEAADDEYIFVDGFVSVPGYEDKIVYTVLSANQNDEETPPTDDLPPEITTPLKLREIVSGTEAEAPFNAGYDLVGFETNAQNELELGWEDATAELPDNHS